MIYKWKKSFIFYSLQFYRIGSERYRAVKTCAFDSICQIFIGFAIDNPNYVTNLKNTTTSAMFEFVETVLEKDLDSAATYALRTKILLPYVRYRFPSSKHPDRISKVDQGLKVDCVANAADLVEFFFANHVSSTHMYSVCDKGHQGRKINNIIISVDADDFFENWVSLTEFLTCDAEERYVNCGFETSQDESTCDAIKTFRLASLGT